MVLAGAVRGVAQAAAGAARPASSGTTGLAAAPRSPRRRERATASRPPGSLQQEGQSFNLRYLELQERLQRETREFTAVSNVMKVRHDAARAAIQNVQ